MRGVFEESEVFAVGVAIGEGIVEDDAPEVFADVDEGSPGKPSDTGADLFVGAFVFAVCAVVPAGASIS